MLTLRLTQVAEGSDQHRVELALEGDGLRQTAISRFKFALSEQDREDVRWYLEDFLQYPLDPAPKIAARIEERMAEIGRELFQGVFQSNDDARDLWAALRPKLSDARVEIVTGVAEAATLPWELLRDRKTDVTLALRAESFVRAHPQAAERPRVPQASPGPIRILLVICRPRGGDDVPFRSVANRLLKGLSGAHQDTLRLDVLRPPTFEQLSHMLRNAKARGEPYLVVHFDGHGTYGEGDPRPGAHGYLLFENSALAENLELVDGPRLGSLLAETEVPVLILNACRSAHADPPREPMIASGSVDDPHAKVRALGSLAHEIMDTGATAVVAMRYNVFVETAAQFMADLYGPLSQGYTVGEAVSLGRKQLATQPRRQIAFDPTPLQDWTVPVVFEAAPVALFPRQTGVPKLKITLGKDEAISERGKLDPNLPARPDAGFFGRDETLLALDRAFDAQSIVLLHAWAGSGKTATAAEFARWYALTGGVEGPVLFSSFEQYKPLARVLDGFGYVFQEPLENAGVHWLALDDANRRAVALQVMQQVPVLWIWDNVEPVAGFPASTPSKWSAEERAELADFLRAAADTKAKFLLTSRREERGWLGDLPRPVPVPPMPFQERVQLARALAEKHGRRLTDVEDWQPLLEFTQGNPLTITVLVGQALRLGLRNKEQVAAFVDRLRAGERVFKDEATERRTKSLAASLGYGFENAFSETEQKQLALLHLFQGFVDVDALGWMGNPEKEWHVPEIRGITREQAIALLDRAAEIGLLTSHGGGYYSIHPALPWFFKKLFDEYYADSGERATRAFAEEISSLGDYYHDRYGEGQAEVIGVLRAEEANLLQARALARAHGWWDALTSTMQGLRILYMHTSRRAEWARLVEEIVPDFVDPVSDGPLPGREEGDWSLVTEYRVQLAEEARQWGQAEKLQRKRVEWARQRASAALALPPEILSPTQRNGIRTLAASVHELGQIQRELGQPGCVESYKEAYELALRINDRPSAATAAFNLGNAYIGSPAIRDLVEAERWYRQGLELYSKEDRLRRARCLGQLGRVAYERSRQAREAARPERELLEHLNDALRLSVDALDLTPQDAIVDLAASHNQLGNIYSDAGDLDRALEHYRNDIRYSEAAGDIYGAAQTRSNVALALAQGGRFADAKEYAAAALRGFQTFGERAKDDILETLKLIALIEHGLKGGGKEQPEVRSQKSE
jgi:tetratricopeptide (TPR) repeat protein